MVAEQTEKIERMMRERRELVRGKDEAERRVEEREEEIGEMRVSRRRGRWPGRGGPLTDKRRTLIPWP